MPSWKAAHAVKTGLLCNKYDHLRHGNAFSAERCVAEKVGRKNENRKRAKSTSPREKRMATAFKACGEAFQEDRRADKNRCQLMTTGSTQDARDKDQPEPHREAPCDKPRSRRDAAGNAMDGETDAWINCSLRLGLRNSLRFQHGFARYATNGVLGANIMQKFKPAFSDDLRAVLFAKDKDTWRADVKRVQICKRTQNYAHRTISTRRQLQRTSSPGRRGSCSCGARAKSSA